MASMTFNISLRQAWTSLILLAGLVPVSFVAVWYGQQIYHNELNHALASERHANELLKTDIEAEVKRFATMLRNKSDPISAYLERPDAQQTREQMNKMLSIILEREPAIHESLIMSPASEVIAAVEPTLGIGINRVATDDELRVIAAHWAVRAEVDNYPEVTVPLTGSDYIGMPAIHDGIVTFSMSVPIGVPTKAVLIVLIDANRFLQNANTNSHSGDNGKNTQNYILDHHGTLITDIQDTDYRPGALMTHIPIARSGMVNKAWSSEIKYIGVMQEPVFGTSTAIPALNWNLVSEVMVSSVLDPIWGHLFHIISATLIGVVLFVWFVLYLSNRTIQPIQQACAAIEYVADGNYQHRLAASNITELNTLNSGFNAMTASREQAEEKILRQAHFDNLTNLPNRFLTLDRMSQLLTEAQRNSEVVAVLFLDVDDFKKINDSLGHECGDRLLVDVASRLSSTVRSGDTVGRLGGDEFIVLLGGLTDAADARPITENLLAQFKNAFTIDGRELIMTVSAGIAVYPDDGSEASELLRNADSAMYHAKDLGRNTYSFFTDEMNRDVSRRLALEEQMYGALERHEFEVFYQPKVDLTSNRIMGAEALLRWHNPALGRVAPDEFIPIAEQTGLIIPLGKYVLSEALSQAAGWQQRYNELFCMAVNFSPRQFREPGLAVFIEQELKKWGVPAQCLEIEITEGVLMSGHTHIHEALEQLNNVGVGIAMDDFGTGYSSLSYLRNYPFDVLKVDRSFVSDITIDKADRELTNAAIAMAHGLNLKVVAEGVETREQLMLLKDIGCDYGQGYYFSRPVPAEELGITLQQDADLSGTVSATGLL